MKKIILIFIFLLVPSNVFANDTKEKQYKFYYIEKDYSNNFYEKGKNPDEYPFITDTWVYSNTIYSSTEKPANKEDIVQEIPVIKYQEQEKVRYIIIDQTFSNAKINLQEIEVFNNNSKIEYTINCSSCSTQFFALIQNTKKDYEYNYISNNTKMILDLKNEYFPDDLTLKLHFASGLEQTVRLRVTINNTNDLDDVYYRFNIETKLLPYLEVSTPIKDVKHEERYEDEIKEVKNTVKVSNARIVEQYTEYYYRVKLYQYYNEIKHYVDGYYYDLPGLIKDEDNYIENSFIEEKLEDTQEIIETQTPKIKYLTKEVFVPIIQEKIKYQEKEVEIEVPKEIETVIEKETIKKEKENYLLSYSIYLFFTLILRKMSLFKR